jgi:hypothetical protein
MPRQMGRRERAEAVETLKGVLGMRRGERRRVNIGMEHFVT